MGIKRVLGHLNLSPLGFRSNPGDVIEMLLRYAGLDWSAAGKSLFRSVDAKASARGVPDAHIKWREKAAGNSLKPKPSRRTALGTTDAINLQHDCCDSHRASGTTAARVRVYLQKRMNSDSTDDHIIAQV